MDPSTTATTGGSGGGAGATPTPTPPTHAERESSSSSSSSADAATTTASSTSSSSAPSSSSEGGGGGGGGAVSDNKNSSSSSGGGGGGGGGGEEEMKPLALAQRDERAKLEEQSGIIQFKVFTNDGHPDHMRWLITLKMIFSKQLPKMPREYITRLVMDFNHRSLALFKNGHIIGGCCFRPFIPAKFVEIVFLAILHTEQRGGYGTHLMTHVKDYCRLQSYHHFLTYADNSAVGYFKKQGFSKEIRFTKEKWFAHIKDYEGGTLMECKLHPKVPYLYVPQMIRAQREAIYQKMKEVCIVQPGKKADGTRNTDGLIAAVRALGHPMHAIENTVEHERLHGIFEKVLRAMREHDSAWPFLEPVSRDEAPDYYDVIKNPQDLATIGARLATRRYYLTHFVFIADCRVMFENCRFYNRPETEYYKCANALENFLNAELKNHGIPPYEHGDGP